jgi:hypothetical protein
VTGTNTIDFPLRRLTFSLSSIFTIPAIAIINPISPNTNMQQNSESLILGLYRVIKSWNGEEKLER